MDNSPDMEELPYVVWYQCRMCTDVLVDDVEKMLSHFEKKHGAMIDCEELRRTVFKNGLCMGGMASYPSKPTIKSEHENKDVGVELASSYQPDPEDDDEDIYDVSVPKIEIGNDDTVLQNGEDVDDFDDQFYLHQNADDNEDCEEVDFKFTTSNGQFSGSLNDDDEGQLGDGDFGLYSNEGGDDGLGEELSGNGSLEDFSNLSQGDFNDYDYQDGEEGADFGEEDGELGPDNSLNEEMYDNEVDYEDEADPEKVEGNKNGTILNYGFSCKYCGKFFTTRRGVESHEQHHKTHASHIIKKLNEPRLYPCKICKTKSFSSFKDLKLHVKTHAPERIHICKFCFSTFNNTASLTKHLTIHDNQNPYKCHCGKSFVSANTLKIHKKIHTGIKPFVCNFYQCGRAFTTKSTLESHLRTHTGEKPYVCSYCPSSFTTSSAKYRHERHVHKVPDPSIV